MYERGSDQGGSRGGGGKGSCSRNIVEVKLTGLKCDSNIFDLRNQQIELPLPQMKKAERNRHGGEDQDFSFEHVGFEIRYTCGVTEKEVG